VLASGRCRRYRKGVRLTRILAVLVGLALPLQAARAACLLEQSCAQTCQDDDDDGECPADCGDCSCCTHAAPVVTVMVPLTLAPLAPEPRAFDRTDVLPRSTDPAEVFHIPKLARV
jgi:hypothetical protein